VTERDIIQCDVSGYERVFGHALSMPNPLPPVPTSSDFGEQRK